MPCYPGKKKKKKGKKKEPPFDFYSIQVVSTHPPGLSIACPDGLNTTCPGQMLQDGECSTAWSLCGRKTEVQETRERMGRRGWRKGLSGFLNQWTSPSSAVTYTGDLPPLLTAVSSLRLMGGWWQGAATLPGALQGVMMEASGQGPQEGGLLVVIPCYLCRGHRGQRHQLHTHTHTRRQAHSLTVRQLQLARFSVCPWEKNGKREANSRECLPRRTPHPIHLPLSPLAEKTQSFLPLLSSLSLRPHPLPPPPSPRVYWSGLGSAQI